MRSTGDPFHAGQRLAVPGLSVEVQRLDSRGDPVDVLYQFDVPLEDPSLRWSRAGTAPYTSDGSPLGPVSRWSCRPPTQGHPRIDAQATTLRRCRRHAGSHGIVGRPRGSAHVQRAHDEPRAGVGRRIGGVEDGAWTSRTSA